MVTADAFRSFILLLPLTYPYKAPAIINTVALDDGDDEVGDGDGGRAPSWNYGDIDAWGDIAPVCNNGMFQSPTHLKTASAAYTSAPPFKFFRYDIPLRSPVTLRNNGHSIVLAVPPTTAGKKAFIYSGRVTGIYEVVDVQFHWGGPDGAKGSEHKINGMRYDVEMHIVHRNKKYRTLDEALEYPDGLVVLAIMMIIDDDRDREYPGLNKIFNLLPNLTNYMSRATIRGQLTLQHLLGDVNLKEYWTFFGSLTTPNCNEVVTWVVFPDPLRVEYRQISKFWDILDNRNLSLNENYRPLQPQGERLVFYRPDWDNIRK